MLKFLRLITAPSTTMQQIFQSAKKLISMCLVTLLLVVSTLTIAPAPARADVAIINIKCDQIIKCDQPNCGNTVAFAAGAAIGAAIGSGSVPSLSAAGITSGAAAVVDVVAVTAAPLAAAAAALAVGAAPVVVPVAVVGAVAGGAYLFWDSYSNQTNEAPPSN